MISWFRSKSVRIKFFFSKKKKTKKKIQKQKIALVMIQRHTYIISVVSVSALANSLFCAPFRLLIDCSSSDSNCANRPIDAPLLLAPPHRIACHDLSSFFFSFFFLFFLFFYLSLCECVCVCVSWLWFDGLLVILVLFEVDICRYLRGFWGHIFIDILGVYRSKLCFLRSNWSTFWFVEVDFLGWRCNLSTFGF